MKIGLCSAAALAIAFAVWWFGIRDPGDPGDPESGNPPGDQAKPFAKTTRRPDIPDGTKRDVAPRPPLSREAGTGGGPRIIDSNAQTYQEFSEEMGFTPGEYEEFLTVLRDAARKQIALARARVGRGGGKPGLSSSTKFAELRKEKERLLTELLGDSGYSKYKSYNATVGARRVIDDTGILSGEAKRSVLYGAYDDVMAAGPASSPSEYAARLTTAILNRGTDVLPQGQLAQLESALAEGYVEQTRMLDPRRMADPLSRLPGQPPPRPPTPPLPHLRTPRPTGL